MKSYFAFAVSLACLPLTLSAEVFQIESVGGDQKDYPFINCTSGDPFSGDAFSREGGKISATIPDKPSFHPAIPAILLPAALIVRKTGEFPKGYFPNELKWIVEGFSPDFQGSSVDRETLGDLSGGFNDFVVTHGDKWVRCFFCRTDKNELVLCTFKLTAKLQTETGTYFVGEFPSDSEYKSWTRLYMGEKARETLELIMNFRK